MWTASIVNFLRRWWPGAGRSRTAAQRRGDAGERLAEAWLRREAGLATVARNWRAGHGEIDRIMRAPDGQLVFVEVRGRSAHALVGGLHSVTPKKRRILRRTALAYLHRLRGASPSWRCDVVEVVWKRGGEHEIRHFRQIDLS